MVCLPLVSTTQDGMDAKKYNTVRSYVRGMHVDAKKSVRVGRVRRRLKIGTKQRNLVPVGEVSMKVAT